MKTIFNLFRREFDIRIRKTLPAIKNIGSYSLCEDGMHVLYLDYDHFPMNLIIAEMKMIQETYDIGDIYIIESSEGKYHAVSVDKIDIRTYDRILEWVNCDPMHKKGPRYNNMNSWVLRLNDRDDSQMRLVGTMKRKSKRGKSKAHAKMLNQRFNDLIVINNQFDKSEDLYICAYDTFLR